MMQKNIIKLPALKVDKNGNVPFAEVGCRINYIQCLERKIIDMIGPKCNFVHGMADDYLTVFSFECPEKKMEKVNEWLALEFEHFI